MSRDLKEGEGLRVSVVTPSFNQGKFIEKTILSVLCQDYHNLEYIVIDGLSNDETSAVLHKYRKYIDTIIIEKDDGQSDALNKGFKLATGDILAYLNSDDCYSDPTVISRVVSHFNAAPDVEVVYGCRDIINEDGYFSYCFPYQPFSKEVLYLADYIPQECTFWRKSIFDKAGPFINQDFDFAMDYELWLRFLDFDAKFLAINEVFGLFRFYASQKSIAQWEAKGLPEIAKLHQKYLGKTITNEEMQNHYKGYVFGVNPGLYPETGLRHEELWAKYTTLKGKLLSKLPLDSWVFRHQHNLRQRLHQDDR